MYSQLFPALPVTVKRQIAAAKSKTTKNSVHIASVNGVVWCPELESNQRHTDFQSVALPTELSGQRSAGSGTGTLATQKGLEPSTSSVTGWHSNQLNYCALSLSQAAVSVYQMNQMLVNKRKIPDHSEIKSLVSRGRGVFFLLVFGHFGRPDPTTDPVIKDID